MANSKELKEIDLAVNTLEKEFKDSLRKYLDGIQEQYAKLHETNNANSNTVYQKVCRTLITYADRHPDYKGFRTQYVTDDGTILAW